MDFAPGTVVADRFVVEGLLGRGGMALVYRVRHRLLGTSHALKVLAVTSPNAMSRLVDEGRMQAALRHPNVVSVVDLVDVQGRPALVLELVEGAPLSALLGGGPLEVGQVDRLGAGILAGVAAAHRLGIVHRDLKPGNVLVALDGDAVTPKVADFGIARALNDTTESRRTLTGASLGTPHYMAPEQIRDARDVDARADVWALGVLLYELAAGVAPFDSDDRLALFQAIAAGYHTGLEELRPDLARRMVAAVREALQVDRERRPADAGALLALWLDGRPVADPDRGDLADRVRAGVRRVDRSAGTSSGAGTWSTAAMTGAATTAVSPPAPSPWRADLIGGGSVALVVAACVLGFAVFRPRDEPVAAAVAASAPIVAEPFRIAEPDELLGRGMEPLLDARFDEAVERAAYAAPVVDDAQAERIAAVAGWAAGRRYGALEALDKGIRAPVGADGARAMLDGLTDPARLDRWLADHPDDLLGRAWRVLVAPSWDPAAVAGHAAALERLAPGRALPLLILARAARLDGRAGEAERALGRWAALSPDNVDQRLEAARLSASTLDRVDETLSLLDGVDTSRGERWALRFRMDVAREDEAAVARDRAEGARLVVDARLRFHLAAADALLAFRRGEAWSELDAIDLVTRGGRDELVRWFRSEAAAEVARLAFLGGDEGRVVAQIAVLEDAAAGALPRWSGEVPRWRVEVARGQLDVLHGRRAEAVQRLDALRAAGAPEPVVGPLAEALADTPRPPPRVRPELLP